MPEVGFPKAIGKPVDCFGFFFVWAADYETVGKGFFLGFSTIHSFVEDKDLVSLVGSVFLVGLDNEIWHNAFGLKKSIIFFFRCVIFFWMKKIKIKKKKRKKKKALNTAEMTNENGGRNDRLEVRNGC